MGGVFICTDLNWGGKCGYAVQPLDTCINLGSDWKAKISSFGPDLCTRCLAYGYIFCSFTLDLSAHSVLLSAGRVGAQCRACRRTVASISCRFGRSTIPAMPREGCIPSTRGTTKLGASSASTAAEQRLSRRIGVEVALELSSALFALASTLSLLLGSSCEGYYLYAHGTYWIHYLRVLL